jgi:hypothetical protein
LNRLWQRDCVYSSGPMRVSFYARKENPRDIPGLVYSLDFDSFYDARASTGAKRVPNFGTVA